MNYGKKKNAFGEINLLVTTVFRNCSNLVAHPLFKQHWFRNIDYSVCLFESLPLK